MPFNLWSSTPRLDLDKLLMVPGWSASLAEEARGNLHPDIVHEISFELREAKMMRDHWCDRASILASCLLQSRRRKSRRPLHAASYLSCNIIFTVVYVVGRRRRSAPSRRTTEVTSILDERGPKRDSVEFWSASLVVQFEKSPLSSPTILSILSH